MDRPRILALVDAKRLPAVARALDDSRVDLHCRVEPADASQALQELGTVDLVVVWPNGLDWLATVRADNHEMPAVLAMAPTDRLSQFLRARKALQIGGIVLDGGGDDEHWVAQILENLEVLGRTTRQTSSLGDLRARSSDLESRFRANRARMLAICSPKSESSFERNEDMADVDALLIEICAQANVGGAPSRVRQLCDSVSSMLGWPEQERHALGLAALVHHCRIQPEERLLELRGGIARHARRSADRVRALGIPGLFGVAEIVECHHASLDQPAPRAARLLKILSFFDELMHDAEISSASRQLGADLGLVRATEWLLHFAGSSFEPTLAERCALEFLPRALGRDERCIDRAHLEVGQRLSRTIYSANMIVVPGQTTADQNLIRQLARAEGLSELWVWGRRAANADPSAAQTALA